MRPVSGSTAPRTGVAGPRPAPKMLTICPGRPAPRRNSRHGLRSRRRNAAPRTTLWPPRRRSRPMRAPSGEKARPLPPSGKTANKSPLAAVPHPGCPVAARACQAQPVRGKRGLRERRSASFQGEQLLAGQGVPHMQRGGSAAVGHHPFPVGEESCADPAAGRLYGGKLYASLRVPHLNLGAGNCPSTVSNSAPSEDSST